MNSSSDDSIITKGKQLDRPNESYQTITTKASEIMLL